MVSEWNVQCKSWAHKKHAKEKNDYRRQNKFVRLAHLETGNGRYQSPNSSCFLVIASIVHVFLVTKECTWWSTVTLQTSDGEKKTMDCWRTNLFFGHFITIARCTQMPAHDETLSNFVIYGWIGRMMAVVEAVDLCRDVKQYSEREKWTSFRFCLFIQSFQ